MATIHAAASAAIEASPAVVSAIIADYRHGHPQILPEKYFLDLEVERGGIGAGTVVRFTMRSFGQTRTFRAAISEPEPGRVLIEQNLDPQGAVTTLTVEPLEGGARSQVTIASEWSSAGIQGVVERLLAPPMLRRIYAEELLNLARVASRQTRAGEPASRQ